MEQRSASRYLSLALGCLLYGACGTGPLAESSTEQLLFDCAAARASTVGVDLSARLDSTEALLIQLGAMANGSPFAYRRLLTALEDGRMLDIGEHGILRDDPRLRLSGFANLSADCARGLPSSDSTRLVEAVLGLVTDRMALIEEVTASGEGLSPEVYLRMTLGNPDRFEDYRSDWVRLHVLAAFAEAAMMRHDVLARKPPWSD